MVRAQRYKARKSVAIIGKSSDLLDGTPMSVWIEMFMSEKNPPHFYWKGVRYRWDWTKETTIQGGRISFIGVQDD